MAQRTYTATFRPQAWVNDFAMDVDPEGPAEWELSPEHHSTLPSGWMTAGTYERDEVRLDPAAPEWVREWAGPFEVEIAELDR